MKTPKINSLKKVIQVSLIIILFTSACVQSEESAEATSSNSTEVKTAMDKPSVNIHTAVLSGNLEVVKQHIEAGTDINEKETMRLNLCSIL